MKNACLFICSIFSFLNSFSQDYYLTKSKDTIWGKVINFRQAAKNPTEVQFITTSNSKPTTLTPWNCNGFYTGRFDKYISYKGTRIANNANLIDDINTSTGNILIKDTISAFLREVYHYKQYTIYELNDGKRMNLYLSKGNVIRELEYYEYRNENNIIIPYEAYKQFLILQLSEEHITDINKAIEKLHYSELDVVNLLASLLKDQKNTSENARKQYPSKFFVGASINISAGNLSDYFRTYSLNNTGVSASFEIGLRDFSQRNFGKVFFQPIINVVKVSNTFPEGNGAERKYSALLIGGHISVGYFFQRQPASFYGSLGIGLAFVTDYTLTSVNGGSLAKTKANSIFDKGTIHPEIGYVFHSVFNLALAGTLPVLLPSNNGDIYKTSQVGLIVRYLF